jgi:hypothetical protein
MLELNTFINLQCNRTDIDYNNANCNGQHGVTNAQAAPGGAQYSALTPITTTGGAATITSTSSTTALPATSTSETVVYVRLSPKAQYARNEIELNACLYISQLR